MRITRRQLKKLISESLGLNEVADTIMYKLEDGVLKHTGGPKKDPYEYKVAGGEKGTDIKVKIAKINTVDGKKPKGSVGASFKITRDRLSNSNMQVLYAAILAQDEYKDYKIKNDHLDSDDAKSQSTSRGSGSGDFVVVGNIYDGIRDLEKELKGMVDEGIAKWPDGKVIGLTRKSIDQIISYSEPGDLGEKLKRISDVLTKGASNLVKLVYAKDKDSKRVEAVALIKRDAENHEIRMINNIFYHDAGSDINKKERSNV